MEEIFETQGKQECSTKLMDGSLNILQAVISSNVVLIFMVRIYGTSVIMINITMIFGLPNQKSQYLNISRKICLSPNFDFNFSK